MIYQCECKNCTWYNVAKCKCERTNDYKEYDEHCKHYEKESDDYYWLE